MAPTYRPTYYTHSWSPAWRDKSLIICSWFVSLAKDYTRSKLNISFRMTESFRVSEIPYYIFEKGSSNKYPIVAAVSVDKVMTCPSYHDAQIVLNSKLYRCLNLGWIYWPYNEGWAPVFIGCISYWCKTEFTQVWILLWLKAWSICVLNWSNIDRLQTIYSKTIKRLITRWINWHAWHSWIVTSVPFEDSR